MASYHSEPAIDLGLDSGKGRLVFRVRDRTTFLRNHSLSPISSHTRVAAEVTGLQAVVEPAYDLPAESDRAFGQFSKLVRTPTASRSSHHVRRQPIGIMAKSCLKDLQRIFRRSVARARGRTLN